MKSDQGGLSVAGKLLYALGAASTGIKTRSFASFLMIYYNQVQGLSAATVSTAIMIATVFDAIADPVVGQMSDNFRSRWGRRHPFMYVSALPTALAFMLIWMPPTGLDHGQLFIFMLACLLVVRLFDTFYELPATALAPELASDYTERTVLLSMRKGFEMVGGLLLVLLGYQVYMRERTDGTGGITSGDGYGAYGVACAVVIFVVILMSTLVTHRQIPRLRPPPVRKITLIVMFREVTSTLNNHAFMVMAGAGVFYAIGIGVRQALEVYFYLFFWGLSQAQIAILTVVSVPGSLIGVAIAPVLADRIGKRPATIAMWLGATSITLTPLALRVLGILPANDHPAVFTILAAETFVVQVLLIAGSVLLTAMIADIVEDSEVKTGRRSEGLLFSADNLFRKLVSGIGVFISGIVLTVVAFPDKAERGAVDPGVLQELALVYIPTYSIFFAGAIGFVLMFRIDRARHEENLRALGERRVAGDEGAGP